MGTPWVKATVVWGLPLRSLCHHFHGSWRLVSFGAGSTRLIGKFFGVINLQVGQFHKFVGEKERGGGGERERERESAGGELKLALDFPKSQKEMTCSRNASTWAPTGRSCLGKSSPSASKIKAQKVSSIQFSSTSQPVLKQLVMGQNPGTRIVP